MSVSNTHLHKVVEEHESDFRLTLITIKYLWNTVQFSEQERNLVLQVLICP